MRDFEPKSDDIARLTEYLGTTDEILGSHSFDGRVTVFSTRPQVMLVLGRNALHLVRYDRTMLGKLRPRSDVSFPLAAVTSIRFQQGSFDLRAIEHQSILEFSSTAGRKYRLRSRFDNARTFVDMVRGEVERAMRAGQRGTSASEELARLVLMERKGLITSADLERAKNFLFGAPKDRQRSAIQALEQLAALHRSGAISESEFRSKKWDILSGRDIEAG